MKRRLLLRTLSAGVLSVSGGGICAAQGVNPTAAPAAPAALTRPALASAKAARAMLLTVAQAGPRWVAAGERGIVLYSDDQGGTWQQARVPTSASLAALCFIDARRGWAAGHMGVILHTEDGGAHWQLQYDGVRAAQARLAQAQASGDERAIAEAQALVSDGPDKPFFDLLFDNERDGWAVGAYGALFRTRDGGRTWLPWQDRLHNPKALHLYGLARVGGALWIVGEQGLMLRGDATDERFEPVASPYKGTWFGVLDAGDGQALAYGLRGNAFVSADQGTSWMQADTGTPVTLSAATRLADGRVVLVSQAGQVLVSRDRGRHFDAVLSLHGLPLSGVAAGEAGETRGDGIPPRLALSSLRGVTVVDLPSRR